MLKYEGSRYLVFRIFVFAAFLLVGCSKGQFNSNPQGTSGAGASTANNPGANSGGGSAGQANGNASTASGGQPEVPVMSDVTGSSGGTGNGGGEGEGEGEGEVDPPVTADVDMEDVIQYCARASVCMSVPISYCTNLLGTHLAFKKQYGDPHGFTGCIDASKGVASCGEFEACGPWKFWSPQSATPGAELGTTEGVQPANPDVGSNCWFWDSENPGDASGPQAPYCDGNVAVNGSSSSCKIDCSENEYDTQCFVQTSGSRRALCGIGQCGEHGVEACSDNFRARCDRGVLQTFGTCKPESDDDTCVVNDYGQAKCGVGPCASSSSANGSFGGDDEDGGWWDESSSSSSGSVADQCEEGSARRLRCHSGVLHIYDDCAKKELNKDCFMNGDEQAICGMSSCVEEGGVCQGKIRSRCEKTVLIGHEDCGGDGFNCHVASETGEAGCGELYSGCKSNLCDAANENVVFCRDGFETPVGCKNFHSQFKTCQLYEVFGYWDAGIDGNYHEYHPVCMVSFSQRECEILDGSCDGNVARFCVGGLFKHVDCSQTIEGGFCVMKTHFPTPLCDSNTPDVSSSETANDADASSSTPSQAPSFSTSDASSGFDF